MKVKKDMLIAAYLSSIIIILSWLGLTHIVIVSVNDPLYHSFIFAEMFINYIFFPIIVIIPIVFLPLLFIISFEGDYIYEDRLENVQFDGIFNVVYFKDIIRVKDAETLHDDCYVYIFDDGRKDNKYDGIYRKSGRPKYNNEFSKVPFKYNYQTLKNAELTDLIENKLKVPIVKVSFHGIVIDDEK